MRVLERSIRLTPAFCVGMAALAVLALAPSAHASGFRMEKTLALAPGGVLDLKTDAGRVSVRGTSRDDVRVIVTAKDARVEDDYEFNFEERGDRVVIRVEKRGSLARRWFDWKRAPEFEIEVPRVTSLEIDTSGGSIHARDIDGTAALHTSGGSVELASITGSAEASTSGGSISAADLGARADLSTSGGSITVEGIAGDLTAETSGGSIRISEAARRVDAETSGGSVTAYFTEGNSEGGSLSSSGGGITAYVDSGVGLELDASTSGGTVTVDLPVTIQGRLSRHSMRGSLNGGGALLKLHTSGGGVNVRPL